MSSLSGIAKFFLSSLSSVADHHDNFSKQWLIYADFVAPFSAPHKTSNLLHAPQKNSDILSAPHKK